MNDLRERARKGLRESVLSHLNEVQGGADVHIALASHGLCIGELVAELVSLDTEAKDQRGYTGLMNTAWTRAEVKVRVSYFVFGDDVQNIILTRLFILLFAP